MEQDGVGLGESAAVLKDQQRDFAVGVQGEEFGGAGGAVQGVDVLDAKRGGGVGEDEAGFVAVAGVLLLVESEHGGWEGGVLGDFSR